MRLLIELKVFRERLRELAYIEGQNITIEPRYWEGKIQKIGSCDQKIGFTLHVPDIVSPLGSGVRPLSSLFS